MTYRWLSRRAVKQLVELRTPHDIGGVMWGCIGAYRLFDAVEAGVKEKMQACIDKAGTTHWLRLELLQRITKYQKAKYNYDDPWHLMGIAAYQQLADVQKLLATPTEEQAARIAARHEAYRQAQSVLPELMT